MTSKCFRVCWYTCNSTNADTWFCFVCAGILVIPLMLIPGSVSSERYGPGYRSKVFP